LSDLAPVGDHVRRRLYSVPELARLLSVTPNHVWAMAYSGELETVKIRPTAADPRWRSGALHRQLKRDAGDEDLKVTTESADPRPAPEHYDQASVMREPGPESGAPSMSVTMRVTPPSPSRRAGSSWWSVPQTVPGSAVPA
jgi:hypothetical protein